MFLLFLLLTVSSAIFAFTLDLTQYDQFKSDVRAGEHADFDSIFETYLEGAGFEELMEDYGREVMEIYAKNINDALELR